MTLAHIIHVVAGALMLHMYIDVRRGNLDPRLALPIAVMAMAPVFWSIGLAMGSETNAWSPWIAIGMSVMGYCIRRN